MSTVEIKPISRQWVKENAAPAVVLVARGQHYLTMIAALHWASLCGPGPERRRHAGYAHARIVADLPAARPESILHRKELLGLIDGLEHYAVLDNETGQQARDLLQSVTAAVQSHIDAKARR